jgi:nicotinate phosphoribosyltransferase
MVIKMSDAKPENEEWSPVIKLSDSEGKHTGDQKEIEICKFILRIQ